MNQKGGEVAETCSKATFLVYVGSFTLTLPLLDSWQVFPVPNERVGFEAGAAAGDKGADEAEDQSERGDLVRFDLRRLKETVLCAACVQHVTLSRDGQSMAVLESSPEGDWVRVVPAGEKPKEEDENEEEVCGGDSPAIASPASA
jgi:hypothetical protein